MRNADAHRIALLRDLLMDYPEQETAPVDIGPTPEGIEDEDAWAEEQMRMSAPPLPLEGRYPGDIGRPDATMAASGQGAWNDVQGMRARLSRHLRGP